ncbi:MAG: 2-oxo acid dehydrogenase subunit E2 [Deltaproteobacteria bacterium]|nr:MAG: 2-oxo acid dehydrogenase subunit E2 [Deltaproteobacteria bacterium]
MAKVITLPRLSDTMQEGVVARWLVSEGDKVKRGQVIAEIETDKATMEFESFEGGIVLALVAPEGETLHVGAPIAVFGKAGEDPQEALAAFESAGGAASDAASPSAPAPDAHGPSPEAATQAEAGGPPTQAPGGEAGETPTDRRIPASPLARKRAREYGLDLRAIPGSGPKGRVIVADVEAARAKGPVAQAAAPAATAGRFVDRPDTRIPLSQMRKAIARRMAESFRDIPHFYLSATIRMDRAAALRAEINAAHGAKVVSFNDLVLLAVARALEEHPRVNRSFAGDAIVEHGNIHVGVAVALDDGLVVPVVRYANQKRLTEIAAEVRDLGERARTRKLAPEEMTGSTITVSNLGMFGIDHFSAVINPGEGAILAVGAIRDVAVPDGAGGFTAAKEMTVTLACDHRAMDGADGAKFLATLRNLLEHPAAMLA